MSLRVLTYNTWHGLNGQGVLAFGYLEPERRRQARVELQMKLLDDSGADIMFLQEINPLPARARHYARHLNRAWVHQIDQGGMKFAGLGFPFNLSTGLAILAPHSWNLRKVQAVRLSGPPGFSSDLVGVQWAEFRYALFAEADIPDFGKTLLVNTHLHHGVESSESFDKDLEELRHRGRITGRVYDDVVDAMTASAVRRQLETNKLLREIDRLRSRYKGVILCGDFNASPESFVYRAILDRDMIDVHAAVNPHDPGFTFDSVRNRITHCFLENFELPLPHMDHPDLRSLARSNDCRQRRIDFIFISRPWNSRLKTCGLFGAEAESGIAGSDHYGVLAELETA